MSDEQHKMPAEDSLFDEWIATRPGADFIRDGVVDEKAFLDAPLRLVFVLKDTHGGDFDLREFLFDGAWTRKDGFKTGSRTWQPIRRVIGKIKQRLGLSMTNNKRHSFRDIAAINVKKIAGDAVCPWDKLQDAVERDNEFIAKQFHLYRGTNAIFICGSTFGFVRKALKGHIETTDINHNGCSFVSLLDNCAIFESGHHPNRAPIATWDTHIVNTVSAIVDWFHERGYGLQSSISNQ